MSFHADVTAVGLCSPWDTLGPEPPSEQKAETGLLVSVIYWNSRTVGFIEARAVGLTKDSGVPKPQL